MAKPLICPKCNKQMHAGFVPDHNHGTVVEGRWYQGKFETKWLETTLRTKKPPMPITTYRCPSCGYLEAYAK